MAAIPLPEWFIDFFAQYRGFSMVMFVYPASFLMRNCISSANLLTDIIKFRETHEDRVEQVRKRIEQRVLSKDARLICTSRASWQNLSMRFSEYKSNSFLVNVSSLRKVVHLDEENLLVKVEPMISVGEIAKYLASRGYMLQTTLEIREATIGGLCSAVAMTTASHKYGLMQETVEEYEVVLACAKVVKARADNEYSDLYYCFPWSHGSLAMLVGITLKIVKIKPYVLLKYTSHFSMDSYCKEIRTLAWDETQDFVESTIFSLDKAVVMSAQFSDYRKDIPMNHVGYWFKPWFYKHTEWVLSKAAESSSKGGNVRYELIPTLEYIFRHDRAIFWTVRDQLSEKVGNHWLFRLLFGWMAPPMVSFLKMPATPNIKKEMKLERVYQDIIMPIGVLEESIKLSDKLFCTYPVLVYPSKIVDRGDISKRGLFPFKAVQANSKNPTSENKSSKVVEGMFYDLGVYGIPKAVLEKKPYPAIENAREIEEFTRKAGGAPFLYADTYMSREEFEDSFNLTLYNQVRQKYGCIGAFHEVYEKTTSYKPELIVSSTKSS